MPHSIEPYDAAPSLSQPYMSWTNEAIAKEADKQVGICLMIDCDDTDDQEAILRYARRRVSYHFSPLTPFPPKTNNRSGCCSPLPVA